MPIETVFEKAAAIGYDGVEIAPFTLAESVEQITPARRRDIRQAAKDNGIAVAGLHWLFRSPAGLHLTTPDQAVWQRSVDYLKALVEFCGDIGGTAMVFGSPAQRNVSPGQSFDDAWSRARDGFGQAGEVAAQRGVDLCFEALATTETNFINTAELACKFVDDVDHPNVHIMLDIKAADMMAKGVGGTFRLFGTRAHHVHFNEPDGKGPGMGNFDFHSILNVLADQGYRHWVSMEPFDYNPDPDTVAVTALKTVRDGIERITSCQ